MPPKAAVQARAPSPTPPPPPTAPPVNDANDILIIQDFMDTIDTIPVELTRVHSDLNELGAVLYSTLCNLERKLHQLIDWCQNPRIGPEQRFQLLQEIAEEAARYKLGGDDKIRVAGGACDGIMAHQRHISALLNASTLLEPGPLSPYTAALTLPPPPPQATTRRGGRTTGSPFIDRGTPTKRKKKGKDAVRDDDDASSVTGRDDKKKTASKRKKPNRAASPTDSVASGVYGKADPAPRTARQIAAAAAKARAAQKAQEDSDDDSADDEPRRGGKALPMQPTPSNDSLAPTGALGVDLGASRESSAKTGGVTPAAASDKRRARGNKRPREDEDEDDDDEAEGEERPTKRTGAASTTKKATTYDDVDIADGEGTAGENEVDSKAYCTCRQISYGEMIGCDDDECDVEWYHLACLGLDKTPEGNWICPQCTERRKRNPKAKKQAKSNKRK